MITEKFQRQLGVILLAVSIFLAGMLWAGRIVESQQSGNPFPVVSLNAATTGPGTVIATSNSVQIAWSVIWSAGVSAGEVVIESADTSTYAGTWNELDRIAFTANSVIQGTYPGPVRYVRARVSTAVVGGTVTAQFNRLIR